MDRKKFAELCHGVSLLPSGVLGIKKDVPKKLRVVFEGVEYYPVEYVLTYSDGVAVHFGVLHDLEANSTRREKLDRVKAVEIKGETDANKGD